jgi:hypothetical protein
LLAFLAGCGVAVDHYPVTPVPELEAQIAPPPGADAAIAVLSGFYAGAIGQDLPPVSVRWSSERFAYGDGESAIGLTYGCGDIRITWWPEVRFSRTALAHELGHCARLTAEGDPDGAHADPLWWGREDGLARQANIALSIDGM